MENIKICIGNLGAYNAGELVYEWAELPITDEDLNALYSRIHVKPGEDEVYIADYDAPESFHIGEYDSIAELNRIAEALDDADETKAEIIAALLADGYNLDDAIKQSDDCVLYYHCYTMAEVAEQACDDYGILDRIPEDLRWYFDFEAYGRDLDINGHFIESESGIIEVLD